MPEFTAAARDSAIAATAATDARNFVLASVLTVSGDGTAAMTSVEITTIFHRLLRDDAIYGFIDESLLGAVLDIEYFCAVLQSMAQIAITVAYNPQPSTELPALAQQVQRVLESMAERGVTY